MNLYILEYPDERCVPCYIAVKGTKEPTAEQINEFGPLVEVVLTIKNVIVGDDVETMEELLRNNR